MRLVLFPRRALNGSTIPEGRTAWTIVPGLAGVIVMISMLMLGALTLVRERERGSWETLLATPVDAVDALIGKLSPYIIIGTVQAAVVICIARLLFNLPVTGNLRALLVAVPLYSAAHLILGFAFSALAESQLQAIQGAVFFYLPSMLLSGFMFPFLGMPAWAREYRGNAATHAFCAGDARGAPQRRRRLTRGMRDGARSDVHAGRRGARACSLPAPYRLKRNLRRLCHHAEI